MSGDLTQKVSAGITLTLCVAALAYYSKSIAAWQRGHFFESTIQECAIKWTNSKIVTSEYERRDGRKLRVPEKLPPAVHVDPIYPDPILKLRPDYFVLPILQNGPNNQLVGFREVIFLAIKLNRTVVVPLFIKHHTDNGTIPLVSPVHRLQVEDLCTFVSCITIENFRKACGYVLHGMFNTRGLKSNYGAVVAKTNGMKPIEPVLPLIPPGDMKPGTARHYRGSEITKLFSSEARCVIFPRPLTNLHPLSRNRDMKEFKKKRNFIESIDDLTSASEYHLAITIKRHTRSPRYISDMAKEFAKDIMKDKPYISIHWRYQPNEFLKRCKFNPDGNAVKSKICANAMDITPMDIATAIEERILSISGLPIKTIYFATPSSERRVLSDVASYLYEKHGYFTYSSLDLIAFMTEKFAPCRHLQDHFNDILSTTEMEICTFSNVFLGSLRSTWSDVVHSARHTTDTTATSTGSDGDIFTLSMNAMKRRNGDLIDTR